METTTRAKKWGNSVGIIIPSEVVEREGITLDDELVVHIEKKKNKERDKLLADGYTEMHDELIKMNNEFEKADARWPQK